MSKFDNENTEEYFARVATYPKDEDGDIIYPAKYYNNDTPMVALMKQLSELQSAHNDHDYNAYQGKRQIKVLERSVISEELAAAEAKKAMEKIKAVLNTLDDYKKLNVDMGIKLPQDGNSCAEVVMREESFEDEIDLRWGTAFKEIFAKGYGSDLGIDVINKFYNNKKAEEDLVLNNININITSSPNNNESFIAEKFIDAPVNIWDKK